MASAGRGEDLVPVPSELWAPGPQQGREDGVSLMAPPGAAALGAQAHGARPACRRGQSRSWEGLPCPPAAPLPAVRAVCRVGTRLAWLEEAQEAVCRLGRRPGLPHRKAASSRNGEPRGKAPNCSPGLCPAGPHKGPAAGEAQLRGPWVGLNPTCPACGHWGLRHHTRDPLGPARGGVFSRAWASCDVGRPQPRIRAQGRWARGSTSTLGSLWTPLPPKPAIKLQRKHSSLRLTHSWDGPPSPHLPYSPGPAPAAPGHPADCPAQACAHCLLVAPRLRAHVASPHSSLAWTLPSTKQHPQPPLAQGPPPHHTP